MQLLETEGELGDDMPDDGHDQGRADPLEHPVEGAIEAVVVQPGQVVVAKTEEVGWEECGPLADAISTIRLSGGRAPTS